jgi:hypothetical protein
MKPRSSYKVTFFDRHGPEGVLALQALKYAFVVFSLSVLMFGTLGSEKLHLSGWRLILFTLGGALTLAALAAFFGFGLGHAAGSVAQQVYMGGKNTPYEDQFSQEQALVMQRDYAGALALFEQRIIATPNEPRVRIAAADLYRTYGDNPKRAAELYREVQRIADIESGHDIYVANKLADLYLGPLKEPGRALVEFRRLAHRYPGTTAATHALAAIANLKPDLVTDPRGSGAIRK